MIIFIVLSRANPYRSEGTSRHADSEAPDTSALLLILRSFPPLPFTFPLA